MLETLQNNASVENFSPREKTWRTRDRHSWKSLRADYYRDGHSTSRFPLQAINDPNSIRFGSNLFGYVKWIIGDLMDFHRKKKEEEEREKTPEKREKERKKIEQKKRSAARELSIIISSSSSSRSMRLPLSIYTADDVRTCRFFFLLSLSSLSL